MCSQMFHLFGTRIIITVMTTLTFLKKKQSYIRVFNVEVLVHEIANPNPRPDSNKIVCNALMLQTHCEVLVTENIA